MKQRWAAFKQKYESFEKRERVLLLGAVMAVVYLLCELLLLGPLAKNTQVANARERVANQTISTTEAEITVLEALAKKDPNSQLKLERDELKQQLAELDERLTTLSNGLVSADQLPEVLRQLLDKTNQLRLLESRTLPVTEVQLNESEQKNSSIDVTDNAIKVYRHGVTLKMEGSYQAIYQFLQAVEASPWQFYWDSIEYRVVRYPEAVVVLNVYTLSPEQGIFNG